MLVLTVVGPVMAVSVAREVPGLSLVVISRILNKRRSKIKKIVWSILRNFISCK